MDKPYRLGVGIMLMNAQHDLFVARRSDMITLYWQMPQGGIDQNESIEDAALRELQEETSIAPHLVHILSQTQQWHRYDFPEYIQKKAWGGFYRGQQQIWFLMRYMGTEIEINLNTSTPEFVEWKWINKNSLVSSTVDFKRDLYQSLLREFSPYFKASH